MMRNLPSISVLLRSLPFLLKLKIRFVGLVVTGREGWLCDIVFFVPKELLLLSLSAVFSMARLTRPPLISGDGGVGEILGGEAEVYSGGGPSAPAAMTLT